MDPFSQPPHGFDVRMVNHKGVEQKLDKPSYPNFPLFEQGIDFCAEHGWAPEALWKDVWRSGGLGNRSSRSH